MQKVKEAKLKIGFIGLDRQSILEDLNFATKNGFDCYEIQGLGAKFDLKPEIIKQVKIISENNNISLNLHAMQFLPISSLIPEVSEGALKFFKNEIILTNKLGAKQIIIHSGNKDMPKSEAVIDKNFEILVNNLKKAVKFGEKYGIKISLENLPSDRALCVEINDLLKVVNSVKGLEITFDVGHANTTDLNPIDYFKRIKDFVINIHIHDNDGKSDQHALIGEGNIDFEGLIKECKNIGYYGPFILEVFPYKNVLKCRESFLNIWNRI